MTDTDRLNKAIRESGLHKSAILARMGFKSYATLRKKARNEREFTASEVMMMTDILGLTPAQRDEIFFVRQEVPHD